MACALNVASPLSPKSAWRATSTLPRLLLVENDEVVRHALVGLLGGRFEIAAVPDAPSAARRIAKEHFDVVLSEVFLGDVTGVDLLRDLHARDPDLPVILMTDRPDVDDAIAALDLGVFAYVKRPLDTSVLDAALHRAVTLSALTRVRRDALDPRRSGMRPSFKRLALEASFERALESLWIAFQPIVDWRSRRTIGFEALMRSDEPTMSDPGAMLDAAERLDRVHELGRCVRSRAVTAFQSDDSGALLFVNLHSFDLADECLFDDHASLSKFASRVVLEITERAAIDDVGDAHRRAVELRRRGFRIAIDDLGAGYAGLTSFATFEPEIVKLDMSLIRNIDASPMKRTIVGRLTTLCHELQMLVVAEGIETEAELSCMMELGCDYLQGYLLGRPAARACPSERSW